MKRAALILAVTVFSGALAVVALKLTRVASGGAAGAELDAASAPSVRSAELDDRSSSAPELAESARSAHAPSPITNAALASEAQSESARLVRIVDAASGNPLDGARVAYFELEPGADAEKHVAWDLELCDAWLAQNGNVTTCGRDGLAPLLARPDRACIVVASHEGLYGRRTLPAHDTSTLAVALVRDFTLDVKVLGHAGGPVRDAPVVLRTPRGSGFVHHSERLTDAGGHVRFPHAALHAPASALTLHVAVKGLLGEQAEARLDLSDPPTAPIELRLPAFGGLDVRVVGVRGEAGTLPVYVEVRYDDEPEDLHTRWRSGPSVAAPLESGVAQFRHLRVGAEFVVSATRSDSNEESRVRTRGPGFHGEIVPVEIELSANGTLLRVRLLNSTGQPLPERSVATRIDTRFERHSWHAHARLRSDAAGVVGVWVDALVRDSAARSLTVTELGPDGGAFRSGTLELRVKLPLGRLDGGDLTLTEVPVLVSGRVVDSEGAPVAGARVEAAVEETDGEPGAFEDLDSWIATDAHGRFALRDLSPSASVRVRAVHGEARANTVECPRGAADVVLTLWTGGAIAGRVLLDADVPVEALTVTLYPRELADPLIEAEARHTKLDPDGRFRIGGLRPGRHALDLGGWTTGEWPAAIEDLAVRSGETNEDPRLAAIDLRGRASGLRVELVPPKIGAPVRGQFSLRSSEPGPSHFKPHHQALREPVVTLLVPWPESDVTFDVLGYRRVELRAVRGVQKVELVPAPLLRLRIPAEVELPAPPSHLKVHVYPSGYRSLASSQQLETAFGPNREVELRSPHLGELEVHWYVETRSSGSLVTWPLAVSAPQRIEVLDLAGDQIFELVVPVEQLAPHLGR